MVNRNRYFQVVFCCLIFAAFGAQAQTTVQANRVIAKDSIRVGSRWVYLVDPDSTFTTVSHRAVPTTKAVRDFVLNSAVDTIYVLTGAGDAPDTICISGPHCALLPQSLTTAEIAELISDSLATIPGTDLSFVGMGSPATLESSTGDDVQFAAGTGIGFNVSGGQLSISNTGILGSGTTNQIPKFTGSNTIGNSSRLSEVSGYIFRVGGFHNSNATGLDIWADGSNPYITQTNDNNNYLIIRTNGGSLSLSRRSDNATTAIFARTNSYLLGNLLLGAVSGTPAARLHVTGSGATSATNSFLAENSSGTDALTVRDDGLVSIFGAAYTEYLNTKGIYSQTNAGGAGLRVRYSDGAASIGNLVPDGTTQLRLRGMGATGSTITFDVTNTSNTRLFRILDNGQTEIPIRSGTATEIGGFTSGGVVTNVAKGNGLTIVSGTLDVNRDSFPTYNIFTKNSSFTANRTGTISEDNYLLFTSTNSESGLPYKCYFGTVEDDIYTGDFVFGRYSLTGDAGNYLMDFDGYSYDEGGNAKYWAAYDGSSSSSLTYSASNFQVIVNTVGGLCKIRATDAGIAILEGENGIEFKDGPVTNMMTLNTDAARLESTLILVNDAADLAEDGQIWKEENRLNFNTANLSTALSGVMFTGTTDATVANTTTETTLIPSGEGTVTIPANYLKAGKTITVEAWGIYTADASPSTLEIKASLGGVLLCTTGANTMTTSEGGQWHTTITFTCRTTGASGTVMSQGETRFNHAVGAGTTYWMRRSATNTVNTTGPLPFNLIGKHGAADADNSITLTNINITVKN